MPKNRLHSNFLQKKQWKKISQSRQNKAPSGQSPLLSLNVEHKITVYKIA